MSTRNYVPRVNGEGLLGKPSKKWGGVYTNNLNGRDVATDQAAIDTNTQKIEAAESNITTIQGDITTLQHAYAGPLKASTVAGMTDTTKVYVYTGSETGYTAGNWYYYDGTDWVSGGVYNATALETDKTLTVSGAAADAAVTGGIRTYVDALGSNYVNAVALTNFLIGIPANYFYDNRLSELNRITSSKLFNAESIKSVSILKSGYSISFYCFDAKGNNKINPSYWYSGEIGREITKEELIAQRIMPYYSENKYKVCISIKKNDTPDGSDFDNIPDDISDYILVKIDNVEDTSNNNIKTTKSVNLYDFVGKTYGKGIRGRTGEIVDSTEHVLTDYIRTYSGKPISIFTTNSNGDIINILKSKAPAIMKVAIYDSDKNWRYTYSADDDYPFTIDDSYDFGDGYIRFQNVIGYDSFIAMDGITSINDYAVTPDGYDVFIFMGQSNMAGRGTLSTEHPNDAPYVDIGVGYEFRAISDPTKLYRITKTFGLNENVSGAINDGSSKTGGMVPSFVNNYFNITKTPIIGVSASEGGTRSSLWLPGTSRLNDAKKRLTDCLNFCEVNGYKVRHTYMVWCQGESDGDAGVDKETYRLNMESIISEMMKVGVEKCFVIRIGECNISGAENRYDTIISAQTELCQNNMYAIMATTTLSSMRSRGLMKDQFHYYQSAYNECGEYAGINTGIYVTTNKEPSMYDPKNNNLYFSHIN